jgi:hypothetical protein
MDRRKFLFGLGSAVAAPAVVRIANVMPVKSLIDFSADNLLALASEHYVYGYTEIAMGYSITREVINDDLTAAMYDTNRVYKSILESMRMR